MGWFELAATTLRNEHVVLRPVEEHDRAALCALALDPEIWRYFVMIVENEQDFDEFFDLALAGLRDGSRVAYHIADEQTGETAGTMSFCNLAEKDGRIEIGWSWLGKEFRGRGINRWAKFLMMEHAFDRLGAQRVEFKTDVLNEQACKGLRNIGAVREGVLRSFNPMPGGRRRDAVYFSVLCEEWPDVRAQLSSGPKVVR